MPIAIGGEVFEDELSYTAKLLGIALPEPEEASGEASPQGGTAVPPSQINAPAGNLGGVRGIPEATVSENLILTGLRAKEYLFPDTATKLFNDVVQRGRTATITEDDFTSDDLEGYRQMIQAHVGRTGEKTGKIDYKDYIDSKVDANSLGGFSYNIDSDGNIKISDIYDFNTNRGNSNEKNPLIQGLSVIASPKSLAASVGRDRAPEGHGVPVSINISKDFNHQTHNVDKTLGQPVERYQTWPERMVRGAISAMALPGDVLSGKVQPGSPQEIERAMDLAGLMVMGPAPVASKLAEGTLGSFAGVTAKGIDKNRLAQAQLLDAKGVHPDTIWEKTGFFRGADDRWRFEIPDDKSNLNIKGFDRRVDEDMSGELVPSVSVKKEGTTLGEALHHPELFKAYPHLKDVKILPLPKSIADKGIIGQMSGDTMFLKDDLHPDFVRSVILHELQHSIQAKEKFARGGSAREFTHPNLKKAQKIYDDALAAGGDPKNPSLIKAKEILDDEIEKSHTLYKRLAGEVEARNVQTRMDFDEIQRKRTPLSTEDTPRFLQDRR